ncbi:MAG: hypothetical protein GX267_16070 [Fibrobacter sp.]|nr:hypothetical protein [Fibrobacter sp.]
MDRSKTPQQCYEELKNVILAIDDDVVVRRTIPYEEAMQEGTRACMLADKYHDKLIRSGIDQLILNTIYERVGAFACCVALVETFVKDGKSHKEIYKGKKKEGYKLRKRFLKSLEFVFRFDDTKLCALKNIKRGRGDLEMIKDLNTLHQLCENNLTLILKTDIDKSHIDMLLQHYTELSNLASLIDIDPQKTDDSKLICAKAWTHLWEAIKEIYTVGRHAFCDDPKTQELFFNDFFQRLVSYRWKESKKKKNTVKEQQAPEN